jgi:hypothetical protein
MRYIQMKQTAQQAVPSRVIQEQSALKVIVVPEGHRARRAGKARVHP